MIRIFVKKEKDYFSSIRFKGHAMYDDYGKDIVCAGASSILITTVNGILKFGQTIKVAEQKDEVTITVLEKEKITNALLENMLELLTELAEKYPRNILVKED